MFEKTSSATKRERLPLANLDQMPFSERQDLMRRLRALESKLLKQLGIIPDGLETIDGHKIYVEEGNGKW